MPSEQRYNCARIEKEYLVLWGDMRLAPLITKKSNREGESREEVYSAGLCIVLNLGKEKAGARSVQ